MFSNLLEPLPLFFLLGLLAGFLKSDLRLPKEIYDIISTYLLLAIGIKGGTQLAKIGVGSVLLPAFMTLLIGIITPIIAFAIVRRIGKMSRPDAAALAAHYGSVSAVTFAVIQSYLDSRNTSYEGYMAVLLILLEIPAIIIGIGLARYKKAGAAHESVFSKDMLHEVFLNRGVYLLLGGLCVGMIAGAKIAPLKLVFTDAFPGILAFFLLEMGIVASQRLNEFRNAGFFLVVFAITMPLISASIAAVLGTFAGLSLGGTAVLITMAASASYIAATAAVRIAVPEANPTYYVTTALGITFPFNIALGLSLYVWMAETAHYYLR
ncbi:MAG: sodium-dependent bicarbonate transport family permease [Candidatus Kapaibacterium sp.]|nr:MAG: sodium-dependent bicarbonate transport family permease [Candidatus Kapabacteria bacterium]